jgi:hypothetical protein
VERHPVPGANKKYRYVSFCAFYFVSSYWLTTGGIRMIQFQAWGGIPLFLPFTTPRPASSSTKLLNAYKQWGDWLKENAGVTDWVVAEHIPETFKQGRANLLQDCIFPDIESLSRHASSEAHNVDNPF